MPYKDKENLYAAQKDYRDRKVIKQTLSIQGIFTRDLMKAWLSDDPEFKKLSSELEKTLFHSEADKAATLYYIEKALRLSWGCSWQDDPLLEKALQDTLTETQHKELAAKAQQLIDHSNAVMDAYLAKIEAVAKGTLERVYNEKITEFEKTLDARCEKAIKDFPLIAEALSGKVLRGSVSDVVRETIQSFLSQSKPKQTSTEVK